MHRAVKNQFVNIINIGIKNFWGGSSVFKIIAGKIAG